MIRACEQSECFGDIHTPFARSLQRWHAVEMQHEAMVVLREQLARRRKQAEQLLAEAHLSERLRQQREALLAEEAALAAAEEALLAEEAALAAEEAALAAEEAELTAAEGALGAAAEVDAEAEAVPTP